MNRPGPVLRCPRCGTSRPAVWHEDARAFRRAPCFCGSPRAAQMPPQAAEDLLPHAARRAAAYVWAFGDDSLSRALRVLLRRLEDLGEVEAGLHRGRAPRGSPVFVGELSDDEEE